MGTDDLERAAATFQALAYGTARYVLDEPAARGGVPLAFLLIDTAEATGIALAALHRGCVRPELWSASRALAASVETICRSVGNDGQLTRMAERAAALTAAADGFRRALDEEEAATRSPEQPDPTAPAGHDDLLTQAIEETFPASDPIAVPGTGRPGR